MSQVIRNATRYHPECHKSATFCGRMRRNIMESAGISWNTMEGHGRSWNRRNILEYSQIEKYIKNSPLDLREREPFPSFSPPVNFSQQHLTSDQTTPSTTLYIPLYPDPAHLHYTPIVPISTSIQLSLTVSTQSSRSRD
jgi:hypothetical protein